MLLKCFTSYRVFRDFIEDLTCLHLLVLNNGDLIVKSYPKILQCFSAYFDCNFTGPPVTPAAGFRSSGTGRLY